jgi:hypothetical protein
MPNNVITSLDQVSPVWLTDVLRRSSALDQGEVESFQADTGQRLLSSSVRMKLAYTDDAQGAMPRSLFLKMVDTDQGDEYFGPSEVEYYTRDYVDVPEAPLVRCYDAAYSDLLGRYHVLLDDVSDTHVEAFQRTPTLEYGLALAEGMAAMHACRWANVEMPRSAQIKRFVRIAQPGAEHIIAACADKLQAHWPDAIRNFYAHHPKVMIERAQDVNGFTHIHGDPGWHNILVPIEGHRPIYIIDRQPFDWSLTNWLGVYDLAFAIVLDWPSEIRRELEQPVLRHYHERLMQHGVRDYGWERLWYDYRLSAAMGIYIATEWCRGYYNPDTEPVWMPMLQKALTAFDDLECGKL